VKFTVINDDAAPIPTGSNIALRTGNRSAIAIDNYIVDSTVTRSRERRPLQTVAAGALSAYITRPRRASKPRGDPGGSAAVSASTQGPPAPATPTGAIPAAGVTSPGTAFTIFYFPAGVAGSPTAPAAGTGNCAGAAPLATCNPTVVWYVDRQPTQ